MTPNDGASSSQAHVRKQSVRRIVPAIPRQLTRPRPSISAPIDVPSTAGKDDAPSEQVPVENAKSSEAVEGETLPTRDDAASVNGHAEETDKEQIAPSTEPKADLASPQAPSETTTIPEMATTKADTIEEPPIKKQSDSLRRLNTKGARMPPPFYPARDIQQPLSAVSSSANSHPHSRPMSARPKHHFSQPSADSIVFGSFADSANASPIPPGSAGSSFGPPPGIPFDNGPPAGPAPYPMPSHSHHPSASAYSFYPQHAPYDARYDNFYPPQPYPQRVSPVPPNQYSGPANVLPTYPRHSHLNGHQHMSRSPSQTSSGAIDPQGSRSGDSGHVTPDAPALKQDAARYTPQTTSSQHSLHSPDDDFKNMHDLRAYLLNQFGSFWFADYILQLATTDGSEPSTMPAHGFLLARSPGLNLLLPSATRDDTSKHSRLHIPRTFYFKEPNAFIEALRYLYGGEYLDPNRFLRTLPHPSVSSRDVQIDSNSRMNYVLSYVAANHSMRLAAPAFHGLAIAGQLLRWETIETSLFFVLDGGFSTSGRHFTYGEAATHVLQQTITYLVFNFPAGFVFDNTTLQLKTVPRLPGQLSDSNAPSLPQKLDKRGSRLGSIQFGETPVNGSTNVSFAAAILSSAMLSVPFEILKSVLEHPALRDRLGGQAVAHHMHAVVSEREKRRIEALKSHSGSPTNTTNNPESGKETFQNIFWEELVEPSSEQHSCGYGLVHRRIQDPVV